MVFEGSLSSDHPDPSMAESERRQAMRTAHCVRMTGKGVVKVVHRCGAAKETSTLDLSECHLHQVPDAVFLLMSNASLTSCSLARNVITKIPPKLAMKFTLLTDLDVSLNRISTLPDELSNCNVLETVNISGNSFVQLPPVLAEIPSLIKVIASNNFIAQVEVEAVQFLPALEHINLEGNPLRKETYDSLARVTSCRVILSPREQEDWEDLSC